MDQTTLPDIAKPQPQNNATTATQTQTEQSKPTETPQTQQTQEPAPQAERVRSWKSRQTEIQSDKNLTNAMYTSKRDSTSSFLSNSAASTPASTPPLTPGSLAITKHPENHLTGSNSPPTSHGTPSSSPRTSVDQLQLDKSKETAAPAGSGSPSNIRSWKQRKTELHGGTGMDAITAFYKERSNTSLTSSIDKVGCEGEKKRVCNYS